jgi:TolA-binding protein
VLEKEKKDLAEQQKQERERMEQLHKTIVEATEVLRKSGANMGADIEELKVAQKKFKGTGEEIAFAIAKLKEEIEIIKKYLEDKTGFTYLPILKDLPADKDALYRLGEEKYKENDMLTARVIFGRFLDTSSADEKAPHAQYYIAETYFKEGKYSSAIKEYQKVYDKYKEVKGAPVEKALMRISDCLLLTKECKKSVEILKFLSENFKKSPESAKAKEALKKLQKDCK